MCSRWAPPLRDSHPWAVSGATSIHIAARWGGWKMAAPFWTLPLCELPTMPTRPFDQGWAASHSMVS
jgi:hypothetical protein